MEDDEGTDKVNVLIDSGSQWTWIGKTNNKDEEDKKLPMSLYQDTRVVKYQQGQIEG